MKSKTVLVTGASRGIGRKVAETLAIKGYNVCINYNKSEEQAISLQKELLEKNCNIQIIKADIKNREEVDKMIDKMIEKYGSIDVVVNNAGISESKLFTDITEEDLNNMFYTTIFGTFNVTQSALKKYMIRNHTGSIINITSIWGIVGASMEVNYSTMKAGIIGMTKSLAKELAPSNIRVNAIAPGMIDTQMNSHLTKEEINDFVNEIPLGRIGKTQDVANVVSFLASDKSEYITGQVINVDGGVVI